MVTSAGLLITLLFLSGVQEGEAVTCMNCHGPSAPNRCKDTISCGQDEVCSTVEYVDNHGQKAFRLGCESNVRCTLFNQAKSLFGGSGSSQKCYECCSTDSCNAALCQSAASGMHTTTPKPCDNGNDCPDRFIAFKENCYMIARGRQRWRAARDSCKHLGGDLVSITSKEEHEFLKLQMRKFNASSTRYFWTSGVYSWAALTWEWLDGSPFTYVPWYSTPSVSSHSYDYYILMGNPSYSGNTNYMGGGLTALDSGSSYHGFICKNRMQ